MNVGLPCHPGRLAHCLTAHGAPQRVLTFWRQYSTHDPLLTMTSFPLPAIVAALAAVVALPFSAAAAGMLGVTAGLGLILHSDYVLRHSRVRLPRLPKARRTSPSRPPFRGETHQLAA